MLLAEALAESGAPWSWHMLGGAQIGHRHLCPEASLGRLSWVQLVVSCANAQPRSACKGAQQWQLTNRQRVHTFHKVRLAFTRSSCHHEVKLALTRSSLPAGSR